jgi:signal transduction histidine kinase
VNYLRFSDDLLVAGLVVQDYRPNTPARQKMLRKGAGVDPVTAADLDRAHKHYLATFAAYQAALQIDKEKAISEYRDSRRFASDWLTSLRPEIQQSLGQVHDYKQFVSQIIQNLNVILQTKYPGFTEDTLGRATHEELAIYWAARLMEEKLVAALFLLSPERIASDQAYSLLHKMVTKYRKIYMRAFDAKRVRLASTGLSFGYIYGNPTAVGVIPHTFIDNALKYAPPGSEVALHFVEDATSIMLSVSSYGPVIHSDERERIFDPFFRGEAARRASSEGTGFGLGLAKLIATEASIRLAVEQDPVEKPDFGYFTTFRAEFVRAFPPWGDKGEELSE